MTEIIDNRKGDLSFLDFTDFANRLHSMGCNFALCDSQGHLLYLSQNENLKSDINSIETAVGTIAKNQKSPTDSCGFQQLQQRYLAARIGLQKNRDSSVTWDGLAVIDLGLEERHKSTILVMGHLLTQLVKNFQLKVSADNQIEMVSSELSKMYEELVLLHKLSANMKVTESNCNYLQMACDSLTDIVPVEGIAILTERDIDEQKQLVITAGTGLINIDRRMSDILKDRLEEQVQQGRESLLDSEVDSPFKYTWPESVKNIIAVPLFGKDKTRSDLATSQQANHRIIGLMVAVNRTGRADFDSIDAKLFNSVANGCAVFIENGNLFNDLKELFIGSLKALTSSIDAKDQYTRGHSERVAFVARWIAKQLVKNENIEQELIHRTYLAGLLHDIGKMGVEESVLRKKGRLTDKEFCRIKEHPSIGAGILGGIKQMRNIVPGILSHHEWYNGTGYPNGLAGEQIPLIAKIISLADSFDAMTSKRTYRDALTVEQAMTEIEKGLGTQFDEKLGRLFLDSDVYQLWDMLQGGLKNVYTSENSSDYGRLAVGTLIG